MPKNVDSCEDQNYVQKEHIYDSIAQAFSDFKNQEISGRGARWNLAADHINGCTMRLFGEDCIELTYHRYEVTTIEGLARIDLDGAKFLQSVVKELKKYFRKNTGKHLKLEKVKSDKGIDKVSRVSAETSWMLGGTRYGHGSRPVGRYLVKDSCVYSFDVDLLG